MKPHVGLVCTGPRRWNAVYFMREQPTIPLNVAIPVLGIDRNGFNYWFRQGRADDGAKVWRTAFAEPMPGFPRPLTRGNCLEIVFFLHIYPAYASWHPSALAVAVSKTQSWLKAEREGTIGDFWVVDRHEVLGDGGFVDGGENLLNLSDRLGIRNDDLAQDPYTPMRGTSIQAVNVREIITRVDLLFAFEDIDGED